MSMLTIANGTAITAYTQLGGGVLCANDASAVELWDSGGQMDFKSDSLEMCARACNCRNGCKSFNWYAYTQATNETTNALYTPGFDVKAEPENDAGKCALFSSNCEGEFGTEDTALNIYAFNKKAATDITQQYPRVGDANEKMVTDATECFVEGIEASKGYLRVGGGGPMPGYCSSGGKYNKLADAGKDINTGATYDDCKAVCDDDDDCGQFNMHADGSCKFRIYPCDEFLPITAQTMGPITTYIKASKMGGGEMGGEGDGSGEFSGSGALEASFSVLAAFAALILV